MEPQKTASKKWNIALWTVQVILAFTFSWSSWMKLFSPVEELAKMWPWVADHPGLVKLTGVLDFLAALGLILPGLLKILPKLTIYTAYACILLMISAIIFHISRGEASQIGINIFVASCVAFIACGRQKKASLRSK